MNIPMNNRDVMPFSLPQHCTVFLFYSLGATKQRGKGSEFEICTEFGAHLCEQGDRREREVTAPGWARGMHPAPPPCSGRVADPHLPFQHTSGICISLSAPRQALVKTGFSYETPFSSVDMYIGNEPSPQCRGHLVPVQPLAQSPRGTLGYSAKQCACLDLSSSLGGGWGCSTTEKESLCFECFCI